ncbi:hypothetical protein R3P38DRAFT_2827732 [Favolaschia claudopus]|uniref:F-box domain-containing protein n=1 Tax=Favolaschia claudopus TaxID=2862362 RepID=A0AAW0EI89_9AGAR
MVVQSKLTATPADILYILLGILPDFTDLGALILTHRCFYEVFAAGKHTLLNAVGRNFLGCCFNEAVSLAIEQPAPKSKSSQGTIEPGTSPKICVRSSIVSQLIENERVLRTLEPLVYGMMKVKKGIPYIADPAGLAQLKSFPRTAKPSATESERLMTAGYRLWRFTLLQKEKAQKAFLKKFSSIELIELHHFVDKLRDLTWSMWGPSDGDTDYYCIQGLSSTNPQNILRLWTTVLDGTFDEDDFKEYAMEYDDEGYFSYVLGDVLEKRKLDDGLLWDFKPILDGEQEKAVRKLSAGRK